MEIGPSDSSGTAADQALLQMRGIVKTFPGVRALDGVDLVVRPGEVHCLLGQNGAGKSTLIKVLAGAHRPDEGEIRWLGEEVTLANPDAAITLGISTIYQELDLVAGLTVAENIFLGHEKSRGGLIKRAETRKAARALLARLGHSEIRADREVGTLPASGQQIVSMARALSHDTRLIVMDEPSAALDQQEVQTLFRVMRDLTSQGVAVVYISHRLEEIREVGDRVTVLKDGRTVATDLPAKTTKTSELIRLMTGRDIEYVFPDRPAVDTSAKTVLEVSDLSVPKVFADVSFKVAAGEIVGLAGLVGSGRSEILEAVYGARKPATGTVSVDGKRLRAGSVGAAVKAGIGLAPEERKSQGLLLDQSIYQNITVSSLGRFSRAGFLERVGRARHSVGDDALARRTTVRCDPTGPHPVRRQPAEGRARPLATARVPGAAARRAHPGRRRGGAQRDLRPHPFAGRTRTGRGRRVQRGGGSARSGRPRPRHP